MNKAFSLIELLVVISIALLLAGGGFVYINDFSARQKMESTRKEIVSNLRLARNYALTGQRPGGESLNYVEVQVGEDGLMEAWSNEDANEDVGNSYYSVDVSSVGVEISVDPNESLFFKAYEGKMLKKDVGGTLVPFSANEKVEIIIGSSEDVGETKVIEIKSSGMINEK